MQIETIDINPETDRDAWLALRRQDVTASVAGAVLDVHPHKTRYKLWMEKAGLHEESVEENAALFRGRVMEKPAIEILGLERPKWKIWQPNVYLRAPSLCMGATPDAYAIDPKREGFGIVQVKTVEKNTFRRLWVGDEGEVEPPLWIVIQAIQEAYLSGASWACVTPLVMSFGLELPVIEIPIHKGVIKRLCDETAAFWRSIENGTPPPPDYGRDGSLIAGMYRDDNGREIDLSGDNLLPTILSEREQIKARISVDKARLAEIDAEIAHKMGENERAFVPGWSVKRPIVKRNGFYVEPVEYRKLTIKKLAEKDYF